MTPEQEREWMRMEGFATETVKPPNAPPDLLLACQVGFDKLKLENYLPPAVTMDLRKLVLTYVSMGYTAGKADGGAD